MAQYIDKSALVAEIDKRIAYNKKEIERASHKNLEDYFEGYEDALVLFKEKFLDTLEVKEVDLNEEYIEEIYSHIDGIRDTADRMTSGNFMHHRAAIKFSANVIEKVLGLIGLKARKEA